MTQHDTTAPLTHVGVATKAGRPVTPLAILEALASTRQHRKRAGHRRARGHPARQMSTTAPTASLTVAALWYYIALAEADTMHLGLIVKGLKLHIKSRCWDCPELRADLLNYQQLYDAARLRLEEATAKLKELSEEAK